MNFNIKSESLINHTLNLQRINAVALPFAVQNALNAVARDVKKRTLKITTERQFDIKKRNFFKANSGYKPYKAKQFNYNINKMHAEVGITKSSKSHDKSTEQVAHQQTATKIKRSINPLGTKPQTKAIIDVLSHKPEVYEHQSEFDSGDYIKKVARAKKRNAPFIVRNSTKGTVYRVKSFKRLKSGKNRNRLKMDLQPIASYIKSGYVKLTKKKPFLNDAARKSMTEIMEQEYVKEAKKQVERAIKRR
jgi:hypothetical protein